MISLSVLHVAYHSRLRKPLKIEYLPLLVVPRSRCLFDFRKPRPLSDTKRRLLGHLDATRRLGGTWCHQVLRSTGLSATGQLSGYHPVNFEDLPIIHL